MNSLDVFAGGPLLAIDGDIPSAEYIQSLRPEHSSLVAADGAALGLRARGFDADVIIGDLDSLGDRAAEFDPARTQVIRIESQEENDLEKALRWIVASGEKSVTVIGVAGGMVDHTLNNFSVLAKFARRLRIRVADPLSNAYLVVDSLGLPTSAGDRISLIPLPIARLLTSGLRWELRDERLEFGVREGASNLATGDLVNLRISEGLVAVFHFV